MVGPRRFQLIGQAEHHPGLSEAHQRLLGSGEHPVLLGRPEVLGQVQPVLSVEVAELALRRSRCRTPTNVARATCGSPRARLRSPVDFAVFNLGWVGTAVMHEADPKELFTRYRGNPIITPDSFPEVVNAVLNPAATMFDGQTLLLLRVEDRTGISRLVVACSRDGFTGWEVDARRGLIPDPDLFEEHWGVEDPRITRIGDEYLIVYTGFSQGGPLVCLAVTKDFVTFERRGVLHPPEDKDAALFPVRFRGLWALIHRPAPATSGLSTHMWLSFSPDLRYWGDAQIVLPARRGGWWDAIKIGLGPPPMLTERGWLVCYHGVRTTASGSIYRLGLALLDRDDPAKILQRGRQWVFGPAAQYECMGDVPGVVFPCGWLLDDDGDTVRLYYGGADKVVAVATASLRGLLEHLEQDASDGTDEPVGPGA